MNILALDIATKTGYCTKDVSGVWDFTPRRDESKGFRTLKFKNAIEQILDDQKIDCVVFERVAGFHKASLIVMSELHGVLKSVLEERGIPYGGYSAGEIKKHATGKGNAKKPQMMEAAKDRFAIKIIDDNHADALWLYDLASQELPDGKSLRDK